MRQKILEEINIFEDFFTVWYFLSPHYTIILKLLQQIELINRLDGEEFMEGTWQHKLGLPPRLIQPK